MGKQGKKEFLELVEKAYDSFELKKESIFLFKLFQFQFSYDDDARTCTITCPISDIMLNPSGIVHGGVYTFLSDTAMGHLNFHCKDAPYVTLEFKTSFIKAVSSGKMTATARYIKEGYNVSYMECDVKNEQGELLCKTTATFFRFTKK